jgi:hypothetical protein
MSYNVSNYDAHGGAVWVIGGELRILAAGSITANGTQASAIVALTDNSAGTANDTIQALPDPTDTPATADILRDDLVAVFIPALRNNIADLTAKINTIITALQGVGITV